MTDCKHLLQQRIMTSEQNTVFADSGGHRRRVAIVLHQCDIRLSGSQSRWNLLLWLASVTTAAACHTLCLEQVHTLENSASALRHIGHALFSDTNISQGSVTTPLRCGGICNDFFIANFLLSVTVKEFWKLINTWRSYGQEFGVLFFWLTEY